MKGTGAIPAIVPRGALRVAQVHKQNVTSTASANAKRCEGARPEDITALRYRRPVRVAVRQDGEAPKSMATYASISSQASTHAPPCIPARLRAIASSTSLMSSAILSGSSLA